MFFLKVDIIHLTTFGAFLYVSPAVTKVGGDFGFREGFVTVVTDLGGLLGHGFKRVSNNFL